MNKSLLLQTPIQEGSLQQPVVGAASKGNESGAQEQKHSQRGKLLWALVVVIAFGAGWLLAGGATSRREKIALPAEAAERDSAAVTVTVEPVTNRAVQRTVTGVGTLFGFEEVTISSNVEGRVLKLFHDVSDRVEPGKLILEIDPIDSQLAVQQAEKSLQVELAKLGLTKLPDKGFDPRTVPAVMQARARLANMESKHVRAKALWDSKAIAVEDLSNIRADFEIAQAEYDNQVLLAKAGLATIQLKRSVLDVAQKQLEDTKICAPLPTKPVPDAQSGVTYAVTRRSVAEGTLVRSGTEVCRLVINQTLKVRVPIPEHFGPEIRQGEQAEVYTAASLRPCLGTVTLIDPTVEPATRTFGVEIQVPNPKGELKPGSFARVAIRTRLDAEAATVPLAALVNFAGINKIFLFEKGHAKLVEVTLGVQTTEWVEIAAPALPRGASHHHRPVGPGRGHSGKSTQYAVGSTQ